MKRIAATLVLVFALTGCAAQQTTGAAPTASPTASASPTPTGLPAVGLATTCKLLYGSQKLDGPAADEADIMTRFVANPDASTITLSEVKLTLDGIEGAEKSASSEIKPFITAYKGPLVSLKTAMSGGPNTSIEFTDYKAAGIEMINRCKSLI